ncbi:MAG: hypothetical protein RIR00_2055, partial [Pseudomonadota bacterium]
DMDSKRGVPIAGVWRDAFSAYLNPEAA